MNWKNGGFGLLVNGKAMVVVMHWWFKRVVEVVVVVGKENGDE